jgi:hypothetical protein
MALPTFMVTSPAMVLLIWPIVMIEARALRTGVTPVPEDSVRLSWIANLVSTFVGIPAAYFAAWPLVSYAVPHTYAGASAIGKLAYLLASGSIIGWSEDGHDEWMFWAGAALTHALYCVCSIVLEWAVLQLLMRKREPRGLFRAVAAGNLQSYLFLPVGYAVIFVLLVIFVD